MKTYSKAVITMAVPALATLMAVILVSLPARAVGPWYVAPSGSDANSCLSAGSPCATINGAIGKASSGDTIYVATGIYTASTGSEVVLLDRNTALSGGWNNTFTAQSDTSTVDGQGGRRGITVNSGVTATIERFLIQNGIISGRGGGIRNYSDTLTLNDSIVSNNVADEGGGIFNQGVMMVNNSTVSNNISTVFSGGGISNNGTLTLNNSTVGGNSSPGSNANNWGGGGISNSSFSFVSINNSTLSGNVTAVYGGGIFNYGGTVTVNNSTISDNTASRGGGIYNNSGSLPSAVVGIQNTIVAGNMASGTGFDCVGTISSSKYNLIGNNSGCTFNTSTGDLLNVDPKLGPLQDNGGPTLTHALLPHSPAINAGNPAGCVGSAGPLTTDQRDAPRLGRCDIGAYEDLQSLITKQVTGILHPGGLVTYTVMLNNVGGSFDLPQTLLTDTLPIQVAYVPNSFSATSGTGGASGGVITWTGTVLSTTATLINFSAVVSNSALGQVITNTAVSSLSSYGGITATASVSFDTFYHLYLPLISKGCGGIGICGRVTLNGAAASGVPLLLRFYNGSSWSTRASTITTSNGNYFFSPPSLAAGQIYYVLFVNSASTADGRLAFWATRDLTTYLAGTTVGIGDFDLADISLVSPAPGATVSLPRTFQWTRRATTTSDSYQFELFDPNGSGDYLSPLLGYVGSYTLNSLLAGFSPNTFYGWGIYVYSPDGGLGSSFYYNPVKFSNTGLRPGQATASGSTQIPVPFEERPPRKISP